MDFNIEEDIFEPEFGELITVWDDYPTTEEYQRLFIAEADGSYYTVQSGDEESFEQGLPFSCHAWDNMKPVTPVVEAETYEDLVIKVALLEKYIKLRDERGY